MSFKITINNQQIKNPVVKFILGTIGLFILSVVLIGLLFFVVPIIWFAGLTILLLVLAILLYAPVVLSGYKSAQQKQRKIDKEKNH